MEKQSRKAIFTVEQETLCTSAACLLSKAAQPTAAELRGKCCPHICPNCRSKMGSQSIIGVPRNYRTRTPRTLRKQRPAIFIIPFCTQCYKEPARARGIWGFTFHSAQLCQLPPLYELFLSLYFSLIQFPLLHICFMMIFAFFCVLFRSVLGMLIFLDSVYYKPLLTYAPLIPVSPFLASLPISTFSFSKLI